MEEPRPLPPLVPWHDFTNFKQMTIHTRTHILDLEWDISCNMISHGIVSPVVDFLKVKREDRFSFCVTYKSERARKGSRHRIRFLQKYMYSNSLFLWIAGTVYSVYPK